MTVIATINNQGNIEVSKKILKSADLSFIRFTPDGSIYTNETVEIPSTFSGGNRNLAGNTLFELLPDIWSSASASIIVGVPKSVLVNRNGSTGGWGVIVAEPTRIQSGKTYTVSFEVRTTTVDSFSYNYVIDDNEGNKSLGENIYLIKDGQWHQYSFSIVADFTKTDCGILIGSDYRNSNGESFEIRKVKLEEGEMATFWTPSPEDLGYNIPMWIQNYDALVTINKDGIATKGVFLTNDDLYKNGNEIVPWVIGYINYYSQAIKHVDHLELSIIDGGGIATFTTDNMIDLTEISTMWIEWEVPTSGLSFLSYLIADTDKYSNPFSYTGARMYTSGSFEKKISVLDVSKLSGEYYLRVVGRWSNGVAPGNKETLNVYRIWGE